MKKNIFRQEVLDKLNSPDELNQYIRSTTPSLWLFMSAIICLLIAFVVWSSFGYVESKESAVARVEDGGYTILFEDDAENLSIDESFVRIGDKEYSIGRIETITKDNLSIQYSIRGQSPELLDGIYDAIIIFEKMHPIRFILN